MVDVWMGYKATQTRMGVLLFGILFAFLLYAQLLSAEKPGMVALIGVFIYAWIVLNMFECLSTEKTCPVISWVAAVLGFGVPLVTIASGSLASVI